MRVAMGMVLAGLEVFGGAAFAQNAGEATFTRVAMPKDLSGFVLYDKVDKADRKIVRFLYINKDALAKVKPGAPLPDGTVLVMEDRPAALDARGAVITDGAGRLQPTGRVRAYLLMEKRAGWGETNLFPAEKDNADWEYAVFKADGTPNPIKLDNCYACHLPQKGLDFTFSGAKIYAAAPK